MIDVICNHCGKTFYTHAAWIRKGGGKHCSRSCKARERTGTKNPNWRGGRGKIDIGGYKKVYAPFHPRAVQGLVPEHIIIMEKKVGTLIPKGFHVHHKDKNPINNDPDNLEIFKNTHDHRLRHTYDRIKEMGGCPIIHKICSGCHMLKLKFAFSHSKQTWDGSASMCKMCARDYMKYFCEKRGL